ncbi:MAG TPA: hypothetical protein VM364_11255 [Vicinamibacterales bacterium]|nr:hypothetical protein [Vicinamibacterales bacterium]
MFAALAAWLSQGTLAYAAPDGGGRLALLPLSLGAAALCAAAAAAVFWIISRGAGTAPLLLLLLVFVPWLPIEVPPPLLMWSGRLALLVWLATAACFATRLMPLMTDLARRVRLFDRPRLTAGVLAFAVGAFSYVQVADQVPGGDEPHYLVITQSLLKDGDLAIENNHRERHYEPYYAGELQPHYIVRGRGGAIYSIHSPGVSALVAPAFAIGGYGATVLFLLVLSALGSALTWHLAWMVTGRRDAAWFGWAAVTLSATWIFHSFTVFPDGPGALMTLVGVWGLIRAEQEKGGDSVRVTPWFWHGAALATLPWMHTRFAVLAGGIGALILLRLAAVPNPLGKAMAFLSVPAVSLIGWLAHFIALYGTPNPAAPYADSLGGFEYVPDGIAGLLFDQGFGLVAYAPALLFAFIGLGVMAARPDWRRYALEHLFVLVPYLIVVTHYPMWWGGRSAPARFFLPALLWMGIPAAAAWASMSRRATRASAAGAVLFTLFASAVLVIARDGALAYNEREVHALWLGWLNGSVDLGRALPMWWRNDEVPLFRGIVIWGGAAVAAWLVLRAVEGARRLRNVAAFCAVAALLYAGAGSLAAAVNWGVQGVTGRAEATAQLDVLRRVASERRLLAVHLSPLAVMERSDVAGALRIEPPRATGQGGAGRNDRPLYAVAAIPAGEYRLRPMLRGQQGWLMVGIGRDQFAIRTEPLAGAQQSLVVNFPVDVRALMIRGDEDARRNLRGLAIEPVRLWLPEDRLTGGVAKTAVRYGRATVYFLDERSFPEPEAFWVGGSRTSEIVIHPDEARATGTLFLRNGAAENTVLIATRGWREELRLGPGEERRVQVPLDYARGASLFRITTSAGFRPSAVDPASRDHRFLGVWVKVE